MICQTRLGRRNFMRCATKGNTMRAIALALTLQPWALLAGSAFAESQSREALFDALRTGGHVIFVRHADTTGQPRDATMDLADHANQRNLSETGRAQARALGDGVRALALPVGRVAASPVFRARDTAELAFGVDRIEIDLRLTADDYIAGPYRPYIEALRALLATPPETGNTWLFGHWIPLSMAAPGPITAETLQEGAAAIFRPQDDGFLLLGILPPPWWEGP
jgi:phosphohistidine phosphatase SixA